MVAGFQCFNDGGALQVDDTQTFCMGIAATGTAQATINVENGQAARYVDISYTGEAPLIAIAPPSPLSGGVLGTVVSGSTWTFRVVICPRTGGPGAGDASTPFRYYIFDRVRPKSGPAGIEIYDAAGRLTFSSGSKVMNILAGNDEPTGRTSIAFVLNGQITSASDSPTDEEGNVTTIWTTSFQGGTINGDRAQIVSRFIGGDQFEGGGSGPTAPNGIAGWGNLSEILVVDVAGL